MGVRYHEALTAEGFDVLSLGHPEGMFAGAIPAGRFKPLTANSAYDPIAIARLYQVSRDFRPDLVLTHGNRATGMSLLPFMPFRTRTVQVLHNQSFRPHLRKVKAALCVSAGVREALSAAYPAVASIETANFSHLDIHPVKPAPSQRPVFGALGRLHTIKGFDVLLKAAARLRDQGMDFELKIAGDGPELGNLQHLRDELGLHNQVTFCGWTAQPQAFLKGLDLFVLPSRSEAFGLVAIEAMASGVAIVSMDDEGPRQVLKNGRYGALFPTGDWEALAGTMTAVTDNWDATLTRAMQAQRHALQTYGFNAGRKRLRTVVESFANRPTASLYPPVIARGAPPAYVPVPQAPEYK